MRTNPCLQAALGELEAAGIRGVEVVPGGKHPQIRWKVNGHGLRVFSVAGSPSDWRAPKNTRSDRCCARTACFHHHPHRSRRRRRSRRTALLCFEQRVDALEREFERFRNGKGLTPETNH